MTTTKKLVYRKDGGERRKVVQVNDILTHPMAATESAGASRDRWKYHFLRVTRYPTGDRPDSGRILVENHATGIRKEFYATLFNVVF